jgi:pimeloyl-ACP methyl ester carboxylesterase
MAIAVSEKALLFGRGKSLVGIVTLPAAGRSPVDRPGILILNAGVLHRVGPNRVHVQMARALADQGFTVLRFDLSGIGDSRARDGDISLAESVIEDVREAIDFMESTMGFGRCLLVGICSGADAALFAAIQEPRVVGAVLIDGYHVSSFSFVMRLYVRKLLSPRGWFRVLSGRSGVWSVIRSAAASRREEQREPTRRGPRYPSISEYCEWVRAIVDRGVSLLLVYTEDSPSHHNYRRLLMGQVPRWPGRKRVSVEYFDGSDHVFTLRDSQERIVRTVCRWASALPSEPQRTAPGPAGAMTAG